MQHGDNKELLVQAKAGDTAALSALILNHAALIRSTVLGVVEASSFGGDRSEVIETTAREASMIASSEFELFSGSFLQLGHWFRVVSREHALRTLRRHGENLAGHVDEFGYRTIDPKQVAPSSIERIELGHLDTNDQARALLILEQCLDKLQKQDAQLHQLIWLKYKKGWSNKQIKTMLEDNGEFIEAQEVTSRIEDARALLGACIQEDGRRG